MHVRTQQQQGEPTHREVELPGACVACEGPLTVRLSAVGTWGYCPQCRLVSQPSLSVEGGRIAIAHFIRALA